MENSNITPNTIKEAAFNYHKGDFEAFGKTILDNDYVMTFSPKEDKTAYKNAYATWKKELELILNNL